jgi:hypothetical protein
MPYAMNFYRDQVGSDGASNTALPATHRAIYVRHGSAVINGRKMGRDEAAYFDAPVTLQGAGEWCELWRWDLALPNTAPLLHQGAGVLSNLRMSRVIASLPMSEGSRWLFRLDQVASTAGRVSDPHQPRPGIRCLMEGTFNINQNSESARDIMPGDAWWENGSEPVVAWGSQQMATVFMRAMVAPPEQEGKPTGSWLKLGTAQAPGNWKLFVDRVVSV